MNRNEEDEELEEDEEDEEAEEDEQNEFNRQFFLNDQYFQLRTRSHLPNLLEIVNNSDILGLNRQKIISGLGKHIEPEMTVQFRVLIISGVVGTITVPINITEIQFRSNIMALFPNLHAIYVQLKQSEENDLETIHYYEEQRRMYGRYFTDEEYHLANHRKHTLDKIKLNFRIFINGKTIKPYQKVIYFINEPPARNDVSVVFTNAEVANLAGVDRGFRNARAEGRGRGRGHTKNKNKQKRRSKSNKSHKSHKRRSKSNKSHKRRSKSNRSHNRSHNRRINKR